MSLTGLTARNYTASLLPGTYKICVTARNAAGFLTAPLVSALRLLMLS